MIQLQADCFPSMVSSSSPSSASSFGWYRPASRGRLVLPLILPGFRLVHICDENRMGAVFVFVFVFRFFPFILFFRIILFSLFVHDFVLRSLLRP